MSTPDHPRSYELRIDWGGPGVDIPEEVGFYESESELISAVESFFEDEDGVEVGRGTVYVYRGKPPDSEKEIASAVVIGKRDAAAVLLDGEVDEDALDEPGPY